MTHQVQFPNLGISVEVNPIAFQVGNFTIYWYGIIIGIGFLLAVLYGFSSCKKMNINKDHLLDAIIAGLLGGIIGARLDVYKRQVRARRCVSHAACNRTARCFS